MSSPVTGNDFVVATPGQSFCERITNLLSIGSKFKLWFDWAFDDNGNATPEFKAQLLPPAGVIWPYYKEGSEAAVKAAVELLGRPEGDAVTTPFWRLCDGTDGTPDLRGRVIVGAGDGTGDALSNRPIGSIGGSESVTLDLTQTPQQDHFHGIGKRAGDGQIDEGNNDFDFIMRQWTLPGSYRYNRLQGDGSLSGNGDFTNSGNAATTKKINDGAVTAAEPHENMPPFLAVWYIIRTSRTE